MIYGEELGAGGISTKTIPPQGLNLTLKGGNGKIDCTFTGITSEWLYLGQYYRLIAKPGSAPTSPMDGVQIKDVQVGAIGDAVISASITGLTNGVQYYVRLYVRGDNGWQTSVDAVGTATPLAGIEVGTLAVGALINMSRNGGVQTDHRIVNFGYEDNTDVAVLFSESVLMTAAFYGTFNSNGYSASNLRNVMNGELLNSYDRIDLIQEVAVKSNKQNDSTVLTSIDRVFPPTLKELNHNSGGYPGSLFEYYVNATNETRACGERYLTRAAMTSSSRGVWTFTNAGALQSFDDTTATGVRPLLCLPMSTLVSPNPNATGSYNLL